MLQQRYRSPRSRGSERNVTLEGVYNNSFFMNAVTSLIGNPIKVHTSTGVCFEGVFRTFSAQFDVVVEFAHKSDISNPSQIHAETVVDKIIFKPHDVIKIEFIDVDLDYATRDSFQTDTAISKFNGMITEKELEPWDGSGNNLDDCDLDGTTNGWDVIDMFRQNEKMYGVTSTFDHGMTAYTTPLQKKDSKDYKDFEAKASKIANEIENNPNYKTRIDLENGDEEEEKFAAVARPSSCESSPNSEGNKYVCPPKRKPLHSVNNKIIRTSPSVPLANTSPSTNSVVKTTSSPAFTQCISSTAHPSSTSRDKMNGVIESPKPQRTPVTSRHSRSFTSEGRYCTSNLPSTPSNSTSPGNINICDSRNSTAHNQNNYSVNNISNSSDHNHHRKPSSLPHPPEHQAPTTANINVSRKISRGKDDQISDLKKFQSDFKLNEVPSEDKKSSIPEHEQSHSSTDSQMDVPTARPSSRGNANDLNDNKALKSKLNPNAKEFVYNPNAKPFTPRSASTPTPSRPHTPQTPGYGGPVPQLPTMVMPTFVVTTAQPPYAQQPNQTNRYRKVHMGMSQPSQMQVAAATGQPLLAPAPMHTQFTVPYTPQSHINPQPYQQMVRMVAQQSGGMVPPVITTINYPPDGSQQTQMQFMGPGSIGPHPHHPPHVHQQNTSSSPQSGNNGQLVNTSTSSGGSGGSNGGVPNSSGGPPPPNYPTSPGNGFNQPPPAGPGGPHPNPHHTYPLICPMIPAPPPPPHPASHNPHHMIAAAAQSSVPSYLHHHHAPHQHSSSVGSQQHHIQVILPHNQ